jgi:hypothetical protein
VYLKRRIQIDVRDYFAVDNDEGVSVQQSSRIVERATGAQYYGLVDIIQFHPKTAAIAECATD